MDFEGGGPATRARPMGTFSQADKAESAANHRILDGIGAHPAGVQACLRRNTSRSGSEARGANA